MNSFWYLLIAFQVKHFVCDYPLQKHGSKKGSLVPYEWFPDLMEHCIVHQVGTIMVLCFGLYVGALGHIPGGLISVLGLFDFATHFVIDRIKAHPRLGGRWKPSDKLFWVALGFDQFLHHLTGFAIIWWLLKGG